MNQDIVVTAIIIGGVVLMTFTVVGAVFAFTVMDAIKRGLWK